MNTKNKGKLKLLTAAALAMIISCAPVLSPPSFAKTALEKYAHQPLNALANEASPYLKQHSRDLVKWHSWNKQTLDKAAQAGRPVLLSIGYSACHWCHVMQEESFNDPTIAKLLNEHFTPILVDREQRPDLDETYMLATEAISGRGGWPNNVLLTPDLKPFYGGVYFPPADFTKLLRLISQDWRKDRVPFQLEADRIASILSGFFNRKNQAKELTAPAIKAAADKLIAQFDPFHGGIGTAPKHFNAPTLRFLLHLAARPGGTTARTALLTTLSAIAKAGVRDHLAGGFHRYAVDNNWRTPHFEKMLYDQAQLAEIFTMAAVLTGDARLENVARSTLDYVLADLTSPPGGFYATRDADSQGKEGTFYIWTPEQLTHALGEKDAKFVIEKLGVATTAELANAVIIHRDNTFNDQDQARFDSILNKLRTARSKRTEPHKDEKILASWNGLMISAFAIAGLQFNDKRYGATAEKAAEFIWTRMRDKDGNLLRSFYDNKAHIVATLPDYAHVARAFIDMYDLTGKQKWLTRAQDMAARMDEIFQDRDVGDYFFTADKQGYARIKLRADTAMPSGNAVALEVMEKLAKRSLDPKYSRRAETIIAALSADALSDARGGATTLAAAARYLRGETGNIQYAARGRVKVVARLNAANDKLIVSAKLAPKWHVNANKPFEKDFIPTRLRLTNNPSQPTGLTPEYPKTLSRTFGFHDKPLAVYENEFDITLPLEKTATSTITSQLTIQACNNQVCLIPETLTLAVTPKRPTTPQN